MSAQEYKDQGNKAFSAKEYEKAIELFTKAIELDPTNHVLYSNRSASYASLKKYEEALEDANKTVELKKDWPKGYSRKGAALHGLNRIEEAKQTYEEGLKIDPGNEQLKKALEEVKSTAPQIFPPDVFERIANDPKLKPYLDQPDYVEKVNAVRANPQTFTIHMQDPRIRNTLAGILGVSLNFGDQDEEMGEAQAEPPKPEPEPEPEPEPVEKTEEDLKKEEAVKEKDLGNEAYKKREFDEALQHYDKAWELDPTNITVLTNKAAVLFEQEKYDECIKICQEAIEVGREHHADFKLIARAYGRIGNACMKLDRLDDAVKFYNKSLTEHRTPDILKKLNEVEKIKVKREKEALLNPELSDQARERGNELFKKNDFAGAQKEYTEAIRRNENDPRAYSNRAACYTKLMAFQEALKDCETCISLDPTFVKAYIRKAAVEFLKKEYGKCLETCEQAMTQDTEKKHNTEIEQQMNKCYLAMNQSENHEEVLRRAASDPEIQKILNDPAMAAILQQMQEDPRAIRDHMKNPVVAANIRKLANAGILRVA